MLNVLMTIITTLITNSCESTKAIQQPQQFLPQNTNVIGDSKSVVLDLLCDLFQYQEQTLVLNKDIGNGDIGIFDINNCVSDIGLSLQGIDAKRNSRISILQDTKNISENNTIYQIAKDAKVENTHEYFTNIEISVKQKDHKIIAYDFLMILNPNGINNIIKSNLNSPKEPDLDKIPLIVQGDYISMLEPLILILPSGATFSIFPFNNLENTLFQRTANLTMFQHQLRRLDNMILGNSLEALLRNTFYNHSR